MAYPSIPGLSELQAILQETLYVFDPSNVLTSTRVASTLITQFLRSPDSSLNWTNMDLVIQKFKTESKAAILPGLRVLVTLADGTVAYDTAAGVNNTFANFQSNTIGENHNTRVAIMVALLGSTGVGNEVKFSTTTNTTQAYNAVRMGLSTSQPLGCVRVSGTAA